MAEFCQAALTDGILVVRLNQISAVPILTTHGELQAMPPATPSESHSSMPGGPHKILRVLTMPLLAPVIMWHMDSLSPTQLSCNS